MPKMVELDCELVHKTEKAWLLDFGDNEQWVPMSVGDLQKTTKGYVCVMPERWALNNGLI